MEGDEREGARRGRTRQPESHTPKGKEGIYRREGRTLGGVDRKSGWGIKRREGDPQKVVAILFLSASLGSGIYKTRERSGFLTYTFCAVG